MVDHAKQIADQNAAGIELKAVGFDDANFRRALADRLSAEEQFAAREIYEAAKPPHENHNPDEV